jgi:hypothetical protein
MNSKSEVVMAMLANRFESTLEYAMSFLATIAMTVAVADKADAQTFDETLLEIENRWAEATYPPTAPRPQPGTALSRANASRTAADLARRNSVAKRVRRC